jgi:hypothetical protein
MDIHKNARLSLGGREQLVQLAMGYVLRGQGQTHPGSGPFSYVQIWLLAGRLGSSSPGLKRETWAARAEPRDIA